MLLPIRINKLKPLLASSLALSMLCMSTLAEDVQLDIPQETAEIVEASLEIVDSEETLADGEKVPSVSIPAEEPTVPFASDASDPEQVIVEETFPPESQVVNEPADQPTPETMSEKVPESVPETVTAVTSVYEVTFTTAVPSLAIKIPGSEEKEGILLLPYNENGVLEIRWSAVSDVTYNVTGTGAFPSQTVSSGHLSVPMSTLASDDYSITVRPVSGQQQAETVILRLVAPPVTTAQETDSSENAEVSSEENSEVTPVPDATEADTESGDEEKNTASDASEDGVTNVSPETQSLDAGIEETLSSAPEASHVSADDNGTASEESDADKVETPVEESLEDTSPDKALSEEITPDEEETQLEGPVSDEESLPAAPSEDQDLNTSEPSLGNTPDTASDDPQETLPAEEDEETADREDNESGAEESIEEASETDSDSSSPDSGDDDFTSPEDTDSILPETPPAGQDSQPVDETATEDPNESIDTDNAVFTIHIEDAVETEDGWILEKQSTEKLLVSWDTVDSADTYEVLLLCLQQDDNNNPVMPTFDEAGLPIMDETVPLKVGAFSYTIESVTEPTWEYPCEELSSGIYLVRISACARTDILSKAWLTFALNIKETPASETSGNTNAEGTETAPSQGIVPTAETPASPSEDPEPSTPRNPVSRPTSPKSGFSMVRRTGSSTSSPSITAGKALSSSHASGTGSLLPHNAIALLYDDEAMPYLQLGDTELDLRISDGCTFTVSTDEDTLILASEDENAAYAFSQAALTLLGNSGITSLQLERPEEVLSIDTDLEFTGYRYATYRMRGYVSADFIFHVDGESLLVAVEEDIYELNEENSFIPSPIPYAWLFGGDDSQ